MLSSCADPLLFCWTVVPNPINMNRNGNDHLVCQPPTALLEHGSTVHNQINAYKTETINDASRECTFPDVSMVKMAKTKWLR